MITNDLLGDEKMKKAIVFGGSNGIGLAISKVLISMGYHIIVCDISEPETNTFVGGTFTYHYCDFMDLNDELVISLSNDPEIHALIITAGIGRVADFQYHHIGEIEKIFRIDTISTIKVLRIFYDRIMDNNDFFTCVLGSISGSLCSPSTSVYGAAKAAVVRLIESVNIELEIYGVHNRILDVSPAAFKGSRFYGGLNDLSLTIPLAEEIVAHMFDRATRYIPQYDDVLKAVLERYYDNPHDFGIQSYNYKKESGRLDNRNHVIIGYLSGTFDLFHIGHLNLLKRAKEKCDYLIVGVHDSGAWKGKETFIPLEERKKIVGACKYVDKVVDSCREDSDAWSLWHYNRLFVGSDYKGTERFNRYEQFFKDKGVEIVYFPYTKQTSSTQIRNAINNK